MPAIRAARSNPGRGERSRISRPAVASRAAAALVTAAALVIGWTGPVHADQETTATPPTAPRATVPAPGTTPPPSTTEPPADPGQVTPPNPVPPAGQRPDAKAVAPKAPPKTIAGYAPFYRGALKKGDRDGDVFHIKNVRELQHRLRMSKAYTGPVTGYFGPLTETGLKNFQRKAKIPATGKADLRTWQKLIGATTKQLNKVPPICKASGFRSCYDRPNHQLFFFYNGNLFNVWLVRGGSKTEQTRTGAWKVFARFPKKVSTIYDSEMYWVQKYNGAQAVHGSVSMIDPFIGHSHGCVNMYINDAKVLWDMTDKKEHVVGVYGAWA